MTTQIFVNLPVKDLDKSVQFFTALGFKFNPQFTGKNTACMIIGPHSYVMLLVESFFKTFTDKQICDTRYSTEMGISLSCKNRQQVDEMVSKAVAAGGTSPGKPSDHGFMYQHGFEDLDGHNWDFMYMDMSALPTPAP